MVFDVRDFGATGDGATDDTVALSDAIAAAAATDGAVVYLPAGTYRTTAGLAVNSHRICLRGDGPQNTFIAAELTPGQYALRIGWDSAEPAKPGPNTALEGLSLTGTGNGLRLEHPTGQAHSMTVRDVGFGGFDVQVDLGKSTYLTRFDRVFFTGATTYGVRLDDVVSAGENIGFDGCVFSGIPTAVYLNKTGASLLFHQCSFDYCRRALWQRAGAVSCTDCHFETDARYGPGGEYLLVDRRGWVNKPLLTLTNCEFYDAWDNYDTAIRLGGEHGDCGLRMINPYVKASATACPYLVRDDGPGPRSTVLVSGAWYGLGATVPKLRRRDGTDLVLTPTVTHTVI